MDEFIIKPDIVYVFDKNQNLITIFDKNDEDTIINPRISEIQNKETELTFSIALNNPKWKQINNPENLYVANDKMYSANFEGCFVENITDNNEDTVTITAYECQKLLSRKFVRAWNSTTGFAAIDTFMVVVLSNGDLPLYNNGNLVQSIHEIGTSGYVLDALLYGTGWTTGTCDVEGIFDFETDQIDIYENILKVQEIWGGILVFDSINKVVHHRDETVFLPYNGYEVKYQKNMQSLEKLYNNKIVTKLCPLGEGGLNIKTVNDGSEWLTNFSYTDSVLEGIENNPDIYEPEQLKRWGERKLQDLCKPRKELTVQAVLLYQLPEYELETISLNDIVDVINYGGIENDIEQLRVVGYEYGIWDKSDAVLQLSDITLESTSIFKKSVSATNKINDGTLNSDRIVIFKQNGDSLTNVLLHIDETIIETKSEFEKSDEEIRASVEQIDTKVDNLNDAIVSQSRSVAELEVSVGEISGRVEEVKNDTQRNETLIRETATGLEAAIKKVGGDNLIRNSAMINGTQFWLAHLKVPYIESDFPPQNPSENYYWYCTLASGNYQANQMYHYENSQWKESTVTRKVLENAANLLEYTTSNEEFVDGIRADTKTISGRIIKFDAGNEYAVTHIFNITSPIVFNQNEEYLTLSNYIKNNIKTGNICIGIMFLDTDSFGFTETSYSVYEPCTFITPDEFKDLTKISLKVKIPKKEDFIEVVSGTTAPIDTTQIWLDTSIYLPKQYNEDTNEWEIMNTIMSLYEHTTRKVWTYRSFYGFYYETPVNYDTMEIKTCYAAFTFYPGFQVFTGTTEPEPQKGLYWNNRTSNLVKRAKYLNGQFIEWETLPIPSNALPTGASLGIPMFDYIIPISGYYEVADIKLEYNEVPTLWTQHFNESYTKKYKADEKGLQIQSGQNTMFIDEDEIVATYKSIDIFKINKDLAYFKKVEVTESVAIDKFIFKEQIINGTNYLLFY